MLELAHHEPVFLSHLAVAAQILRHKAAIHSEVHHARLLGCHLGIAHQPLCGIVGKLGSGAEAYRVHVDIDGALHAATALGNFFPVHERVAHEDRGRNGGNGVVEVAHLHRGERHLLHISVNAELVDGNPVARLQHIVHIELNASYETHNAVAEQEHHHRGSGTESGDEREW